NYNNQCSDACNHTQQRTVIAESLGERLSYWLDVDNVARLDDKIVLEITIDGTEVSEEHFAVAEYAYVGGVGLLIQSARKGKHFGELHILMTQRDHLSARRTQYNNALIHQG